MGSRLYSWPGPACASPTPPAPDLSTGEHSGVEPVPSAGLGRGRRRLPARRCTGMMYIFSQPVSVTSSCAGSDIFHRHHGLRLRQQLEHLIRPPGTGALSTSLRAGQM
ncbi:hypothetical protein GCM10010358_24960 [Streptomyces minutiscleroticus]|uniref:Uncharacterized protein n=1 Tax=Streptomyces minutiscleroticus TaxID=68238 RepID=A0A918NFN9_9ACTN|nr:hypothetical protein GCM10010358_24960 [Streptomyces minutiscleroticus]